MGDDDDDMAALMPPPLMPMSRDDVVPPPPNFGRKASRGTSQKYQANRHNVYTKSAFGPKRVSMKDVELEEELSLEDLKFSNHRSGGNKAAGAGSLSFNESIANFVTFVPKYSEENDFLLRKLKDNFIFGALSKKELYCVVDSMEKEVRYKDEVIIQEGDTSDDNKAFYVLQKGKIKYLIKGNEAGIGRAGGTFGEMSLLYDTPRGASCIVASDEATLWKVDQDTFRFVLSHESQKSSKGFRELVRKIPLFKNLSASDISKLADAVKTEQFQENDRIVTKGAQGGEKLFVIQKGYVIRSDFGRTQGSVRFVNQSLTTGDWFGDWNVLHMTTSSPDFNESAVGMDLDSKSDNGKNNSGAEANLTAQTDVTVFSINREDFEKAVGNIDNILRREMKKQFLKSVPILANSDFSETEFTRLQKLLIKREYKKKFKFKYKEKPSMWIIREGHVQLTIGDDEKLDLKTGDFFGDQWIKMSQKELDACTHSAVCMEHTKCYKITREEIVRVIGQISRLGSPLPYVNPHKLKEKIAMEDLEKHAPLGQGQFGTVWLTKHKKKGTIYALKSINKLALIEHDGSEDMITNVFNEKNVLNTLNHPFIIQLHATFQDKQKLYFLLPLIQGGELFGLIYLNESTPQDGIAKKKDQAFYSACIIEALQHIHMHHIAFRDLKPENVLIGDDGYCVIVDFGFAKIVYDKTYTLCGTPDYLAPEVLLSKGHNQSADHWSLGVTIYEIIAGETPFNWEGATQQDVTKAILSADYSFENSNHDDNDDDDDDAENGKCKFSKKAKNIISQLLVLEPLSRLGNSANGCQDIMDNEFFSGNGIDFDKLRNKEMPAPWKPDVKDAMDITSFGEVEVEDLDVMIYRDLKDYEDKLFEGFEK